MTEFLEKTSPVTASGSFLDGIAAMEGKILRMAVKLPIIQRIIQFFYYRPNELMPPPKYYRWETDAELRQRLLKTLGK